MELLQIKASMWVYCWLFVQLLDHMCCPSTVSLRMELEEEVAAVEQNGTEMVLLGPPDDSHLHKTKLFQNSPTTSAKHEKDSFSFLLELSKIGADGDIWQNTKRGEPRVLVLFSLDFALCRLKLEWTSRGMRIRRKGTSGNFRRGSSSRNEFPSTTDRSHKIG